MLTPDEAKRLDTDGYVVLGSVLDDLDHYRAIFPEFGDIQNTPRVLEAIRYVLQREFGVQNIGPRSPQPGLGQQGLHMDWPTPAAKGAYVVATALFLLDDFTKENGATRIIPGSHLWARPLTKAEQQPNAHHAKEIVIEAKAGSALVLNRHVWHSGTRNRTQGQRRTIQCQYRLS